MSNQQFDNVTRFEVIGPNGREVTSYGVQDITLSIQDDGKTLKIFYTVDEDLAEKVQGDMSQGLNDFFKNLTTPHANDE